VVRDQTGEVWVVLYDVEPVQLGEIEERLVKRINFFHIMGPVLEDPANSRGRTKALESEH
jgi:hypothetical protein